MNKLHIFFATVLFCGACYGMKEEPTSIIKSLKSLDDSLEEFKENIINKKEYLRSLISAAKSKNIEPENLTILQNELAQHIYALTDCYTKMRDVIIMFGRENPMVYSEEINDYLDIKANIIKFLKPMYSILADTGGKLPEIQNSQSKTKKK